MKRRKILLTAFVLLTAANIIIYFKRDQFTYHSYPSYSCLYGICEDDCKDKWEQWTDDYPAEELVAAKKLIDSSLQLQNKNSFEKILQTGNFLRNRFHLQEGTPSALLSSASPFEQFNLLRSDKNKKLWCGNYANMMAWFCRSQGITTRIIEIINPGDHHVVNECYLPENGKWMMVDLTNNLLAIEDETQYPLHLIGLLDKKVTGTLVWGYRSINDSITKDSLKPQQFLGSYYFQKRFDLHYYQRTNLNAVYTTGEKIKRYLLPQSWYSIYKPAKRPGNNLSYVIKLFFICSWLIIIFALLRLFLPSRKRIS